MKKLPTVKRRALVDLSPLVRALRKIQKSVAAQCRVRCKFCSQLVPTATAHRHDGGWVGDACCWDERLRSSE
jgi:hypothetical protein